MTYKDLYEKRKIMYATKYGAAVAEDDMKKAYNILGKLMKYHMLDTGDKILSKANLKKFEKAGIDEDHRFEKDYRRDAEFLPANLFYDVPNYTTVDIVSEAHWGKRVELVYEGDIIVPEKTYSFDIREQVRPGSAFRALNSMKSMYKQESTFDLNVNWEGAIESGNSKIYEVTLGNGQHFVFNVLGYVCVHISNKRARLNILLSNSNMIKTHINIKKAYDIVAGALVGGLVDSGLNIENIEIAPLCNVKEARAYQVRLYSKEPPLNYDKFCDIENRKAAQLAEAKEQ